MQTRQTIHGLPAGILVVTSYLPPWLSAKSLVSPARTSRARSRLATTSELECSPLCDRESSTHTKAPTALAGSLDLVRPLHARQNSTRSRSAGFWITLRNSRPVSQPGVETPTILKKASLSEVCRRAAGSLLRCWCTPAG